VPHPGPSESGEVSQDCRGAVLALPDVPEARQHRSECHRQWPPVRRRTVCACRHLRPKYYKLKLSISTKQARFLRARLGYNKLLCGNRVLHAARVDHQASLQTLPAHCLGYSSRANVWERAGLRPGVAFGISDPDAAPWFRHQTWHFTFRPTAAPGRGNASCGLPRPEPETFD